MFIKRLSRASTPAVSLLRAKQRLRIDSDDNDDDITALLAAAEETFERKTGRVLQPSDWELRVDGWPLMSAGGNSYVSIERAIRSFRHPAAWRTIEIPIAPVRDVTGVSYLDVDGAEQHITPSSESWRWERTPEGALVIFSRDYIFPWVSSDPQCVRVQFSAGYDDPSLSGSGDDAELVLPKAAETAILFLVSTWNEVRESVSVGRQPAVVPQTLDLLVEGLRIYR